MSLSPIQQIARFHLFELLRLYRSNGAECTLYISHGNEYEDYLTTKSIQWGEIAEFGEIYGHARNTHILIDHKDLPDLCVSIAVWDAYGAENPTN